MKRDTFIRSLAFSPLIASALKLKDLKAWADKLDNTDQMPVLFVGHGSPMNAIETNRFSLEMQAMGKQLPKPKAILMVSAHWETKGTFVTAQEMPPTIHDFGGFPKALFDAQYPAPGSKWLAEETQKEITTATVHMSDTWGFDHGCWSVTKNMYPAADIPIVQLSLDYTQPASYHYALGKQLANLRNKGVLIIGSGNMVHNLRMVQLKSADFNETFGFDWAIQANTTLKQLIQNNDHAALADYKSLGKEIQLAVPTPEHYLPLLYALSLRTSNDEIMFFNDVPVGGSISMTSLLIA